MDRVSVFKQKFLRSWFCNKLTVIIQRLNVVNYDHLLPFSAYSIQNKVGNGKLSLEMQCCYDREKTRAINTLGVLGLCVNNGKQHRIDSGKQHRIDSGKQHRIDSGKQHRIDSGKQHRIGLTSNVMKSMCLTSGMLLHSSHTHCVRRYSSDVLNDNNLDDDDDDIGNVSAGEQLLKDDLYSEGIKQYCSLPDAGHRVFILQIEVTGSTAYHNKSPGRLQLAENVALVQAIPRWTVIGSDIKRVKEPSSLNAMERAFDSAAEVIRNTPAISAVFVSRNILSAQQIVMAQSKWRLPVFDRSFILTQVFKAEARTRETKLHVALAELPFFRFCMNHGFQPGSYDKPEQRRYIKWPFKEREKKIKAALVSLKKQRMLIRDRRSSRKIPTIAVIGYTNSGKTTVIKALTGDEALIPQNKLFATLDVTSHGSILPNNMMVLYMDTVGFLTDLPVNLKSAFMATLEETIHADLVIHVRDASHPDVHAQKLNVLQSVQKLLHQQKLDTMIEVCNKVDRIDGRENLCTDKKALHVSAVTSEGMEELKHEIQTRLLQNIDFLQKKLKIPLNGSHLEWLHKQATVVSTETDADPENLLVNIYISEANYRKFLAKFSPRKMAGINR